MTHLYNDPRNFRDEFFSGFLSAYGDRIVEVEDSYGAMRADGPPAGRVAVLIGGGSGHYPTRCGLVGPGLADIAVVGNTFASPSSQQILRCTRAVHGGYGVVYLYGNYSGDCLNFDMAAAAAEAEGIRVRQVVGTDDVASAPQGSEAERRGVAGDFFLFKIAGAAADDGRDLDGVAAAALRANARIRSFGVAFAGYVLPGQIEPLFTVAPGQMEIGLGIHGEPGTASAKMLPADEVAALLVEKVLRDVPMNSSGQVAVLVNSLGSTTPEELFVLYRKIQELLSDAGLQIHHVIVDSLTSSMDMAGCSLSLMWLDEDLARLYDMPASAPGYTHHVSGQAASTRTQTRSKAKSATLEGDAVNLAAARVLTIIEDNEELLGRLDALAGDGDHGRTVVAGMRAAVAALPPEGNIGPRLVVAGQAFAEASGGASGVLFGSFIEAAGVALTKEGSHSDEDVAQALRAGLNRVRALGKADVGDKTMVDALQPFCDELDCQLTGGAPLSAAWHKAAEIAAQGAAATAALVARRGRASKLGDRSLGGADPGATSAALAFTALGPAFPDATPSSHNSQYS